LEVDDHSNHHRGGEKIGKVWEIGAEERLAKGSNLVAAGEEEVEEGNDRALELYATANIDTEGT
jgi:hypothetical protein